MSRCIRNAAVVPSCAGDTVIHTPNANASFVFWTVQNSPSAPENRGRSRSEREHPQGKGTDAPQPKENCAITGACVHQASWAWSSCSIFHAQQQPACSTSGEGERYFRTSYFVFSTQGIFSIPSSPCGSYYSIANQHQTFIKHRNTALHRSMDSSIDRGTNTPQQKLAPCAQK